MKGWSQLSAVGGIKGFMAAQIFISIVDGDVLTQEESR